MARILLTTFTVPPIGAGIYVAADAIEAVLAPFAWDSTTIAREVLLRNGARIVIEDTPDNIAAAVATGMGTVDDALAIVTRVFPDHPAREATLATLEEKKKQAETPVVVDPPITTPAGEDVDVLS